MYRFQMRRLRGHKQGRGRIHPVWTPWKTIETMHKIPDLTCDLDFPSGLVQFRLVLADKTVWRSAGKREDKYWRRNGNQVCAA